MAHQFAGQAEDRHAGGQHAAGFAVGFEDGDFVADADEVVRHGQAGDAGADHGDPFVIAAIGRQHVVVVGFAIDGVVAGLRAEAAGDEALERADGDRRIDIAAAAVGLAGRTADAPADGGERVVRAGDAVGVLVAAFGDGGDVAAGIGVHRAGVLALHHLASSNRSCPGRGLRRSRSAWRVLVVRLAERKCYDDDAEDDDQGRDGVHQARRRFGSGVQARTRWPRSLWLTSPFM